MIELKNFESKDDYDSESKLEGGKWIIDTEPNAIIATTKFYPSE
jgi:hypothetical protein